MTPYGEIHAHRLRPLRGAGSASAALAAALVAAPSAAVEWHTVPSVTVAASYDENLRLDPFNPQPASSTSTTAEATIEARDERFRLDLAPQVRAVRYADDVENDRNDVFANLGFVYDQERNHWSFGGNYARDSTLTNGFEDTGVLIPDVERTDLSWNAGWSMRQGARGNVGVAATTLDVRFADDGQPGDLRLNDYDYDVLQASYSRVTSSRTSWQLGLSRSRLEPALTGIPTLSKSLSIGWTHGFSEHLRASAGVGAFVNKREGILGEHQEIVPSFNFSVLRTWRRWSLSAGGSRDQRPQGSGTLITEDTVSVTMGRRLTERMALGVSVRTARVVDTLLPFDIGDREYSTANANVQYQVGRHWALVASIDDRVQDVAFAPRVSGLSSTVTATYRGR